MCIICTLQTSIPMSKEQFLSEFLFMVRHLTTDTPIEDDCVVIDYIESTVTKLKEHGFTVGYAYEPTEVHLVGKIETIESMADFGASEVVIIDGVIIRGDVFEVISKSKTANKIKCTPLPNVIDFKTKDVESLDNPFWLIEPVNFSHRSFIGVAQGAYCLGFITDSL